MNAQLRELLREARCPSAAYGKHPDQCVWCEARAAALAAPKEAGDAPQIHPDTIRLNWLEHMARHGGLFLCNGVDVERERASAPGLGLRPGKIDRTLREAIDQAKGQP